MGKSVEIRKRGSKMSGEHYKMRVWFKSGMGFQKCSYAGVYFRCRKEVGLVVVFSCGLKMGAYACIGGFDYEIAKNGVGFEYCKFIFSYFL